MTLVLPTGVSATQSDLMKLTVGDLLNVGVNLTTLKPGLKKQQIIDILIAAAASGQISGAPVGTNDEKTWLEAAVAARGVELKNVPMIWGDARVFLDPYMIVLMLRKYPIDDSELLDSYGFEGKFMEKIRRGWHTRLPHLTDEVLNDWCNNFQDLRMRLLQSISSKLEPAVFFQRHSGKLKSMLSDFIKAQCACVEAKGYRSQARTAEAKMLVADPTEMTVGLGETFKNIKFYNQFDNRGGRRFIWGKRFRGDDKENKEEKEGKKCSRCPAVVPYGGFKAHNLICPGKPKGENK